MSLTKSQKKRLRRDARNDETIYYNLLKQRFLCWYCGQKMIEKTIDHIKPLSRGGNNDTNNILICCPSCNYKKGGAEIEDYIFPNSAKLRKKIKRIKNLGYRVPSSKNLLIWCQKNNIKMGKYAIFVTRKREL